MWPPLASRQRERRLERLGAEIQGGHVALEMVDRREWEAPRPGECLGRGDADEERADEAWALRDGDPIDVVERHLRVVECRPHDRGHELEVPARRDLGDDASESRMQIGLRGDDGREHVAFRR